MTDHITRESASSTGSEPPVRAGMPGSGADLWLVGINAGAALAIAAFVAALQVEVVCGAMLEIRQVLVVQIIDAERHAQIVSADRHLSPFLFVLRGLRIPGNSPRTAANFSNPTLGRDERGQARPSRPGSLFDRVIQTYGGSAFGHHALAAPHDHGRSGHRIGPAKVRRHLDVAHLPAASLAIIVGVLALAIRPDRTGIIHVMA